MSEADYLNEIRQLVELQKVDDEIFAVNRNLENAPRELDDLRQKFMGIESRREHVLDKLSHLKEQKKRVTSEIDDDSAKIKKSRNKLMQVENTREYQAVLREMDSMEKNNRTREEEKNTLLEELENQNNVFERIDSEYNETRKELDEKRASLDATIQEGKDRLRKLQQDRVMVSRDISRPIFQRYEFIRNRLEHPVIVSVDGGICSGCHIAIPPQSFIELQSGQQILSCPNCQRLIFWNNFFEDPEQVKADDVPPRNEIEEDGALEDLEEEEEAEDDLIMDGGRDEEGEGELN